ncbi:MAG: hypothetical protein HY000_05135 [Planctomycetes bacterium]|nr:hypothetical protein [Planctomycetota bacterium]
MATTDRTQRAEDRDQARAERARQIIVEILHQAGGEITSRAALSRAFYFAHLYYADRASGYLGFWPILRAADGPVIGQLGDLLADLVTKGIAELGHVQQGPYTSMCYRLTSRELRGEGLDSEAVQSIQDAVNLVQQTSPAELGELIRQNSRSWSTTADGEEMRVIYVDSGPDDEHELWDRRLQEIEEAMNRVWNERLSMP